MSKLPIEQMKRDANSAIKAYNKWSADELMGDLGCHVLALLRELDHLESVARELVAGASRRESPEGTALVDAYDLDRLRTALDPAAQPEEDEPR